MRLRHFIECAPIMVLTGVLFDFGDWELWAYLGSSVWLGLWAGHHD